MAETEVIARILATGFNKHAWEHGPGGDHAGEAFETGDGHGFLVTRQGVPYAVRVERVRPLHEPGPLTPGQAWAALKAHLGDLDDPASRAVLAKMRELEGS